MKLEGNVGTVENGGAQRETGHIVREEGAQREMGGIVRKGML